VISRLDENFIKNNNNRHEVRQVRGCPIVHPQLYRELTTLCRELNEELVPEWRLKYLDYKVRILNPSLENMATANADDVMH
jgi:hypothetical protein